MEHGAQFMPRAPYPDMAESEPRPRHAATAGTTGGITYDGFVFTCYEPEAGEKRTWARVHQERMEKKSQKELVDLVKRDRISGNVVSKVFASKEMATHKREHIERLLEEHNNMENDDSYVWKPAMIRPRYKNTNAKERITTSIDVIVKRVPRTVVHANATRQTLGPNTRFIDLNQPPPPRSPRFEGERPHSAGSEELGSDYAPFPDAPFPTAPFMHNINPGMYRAQGQGFFRSPARRNPNIEVVNEDLPPHVPPPMLAHPPAGYPMPEAPLPRMMPAGRPHFRDPAFVDRPSMQHPMPSHAEQPMGVGGVGAHPVGTPQASMGPDPNLAQGYKPTSPEILRRTPKKDKDKRKHKRKPAIVEIHQGDDMSDSDSSGRSIFSDNATIRTPDSSVIGEEVRIKDKDRKRREGSSAAHHTHRGERRRNDGHKEDTKDRREEREHTCRVHARSSSSKDSGRNVKDSDEEADYVVIERRHPRGEGTRCQTRPTHHRGSSYGSTIYPRTAFGYTDRIDELQERSLDLDREIREREAREKEREVRDKEQRLRDMEERQRERKLEQIQAKMDQLSVDEREDRANHYDRDRRPIAAAAAATATATRYPSARRDPFSRGDSFGRETRDIFPRDVRDRDRGRDRGRDRDWDRDWDRYGAYRA